ncbi:hypothetical protein ES702_04466 [subsurface metagenome]
MKCKYCGCTDEKACVGGCSWAKDYVCSNCLYSLGSLETLAGRYLDDPEIVLAVITFTDKNGEQTSFEITK